MNQKQKLQKMKYGAFFRMLLAGWISTVMVACQQPDEGAVALREIRFDLSLEAQTRAPQAIDFNRYAVSLYVFEASETSSACVRVMEVTSSSFTVDGLERNTSYRCVFLAIPKGQQPSLPSEADTYETSVMQYLEGNQPDQEVFRSLLTLSTNQDITSYSVVLTRQNGALQIRMGNADGSIRTAQLEVEGLPTMLFQDGGDGRVLSTGDPVQLSKSGTPAMADDYRISVNLLPAEDVTGKGRLTLTLVDGTQETYDLKSTSGTIPVYPNQITWLVLRGTGEGGSFEVGFGGDIDLDDDQWDGYM